MDTMRQPSVDAEIKNQMMELDEEERTGLPKRYVIDHVFKSIKGRVESREQALSSHVAVADYNKWKAKKHYDDEEATTVLFTYANKEVGVHVKRPAGKHSKNHDKEELSKKDTFRHYVPNADSDLVPSLYLADNDVEKSNWFLRSKSTTPEHVLYHHYKKGHKGAVQLTLSEYNLAKNLLECYVPLSVRRSSIHS